MNRSDPNDLAGYSHVNDSVALENGGKLPGDPELQFDYDERATHERRIARLRLLWTKRRFLARVAGIALVCSAALALLLPTRYKSEAKLMPPDSQSGSGLAMAAAALTGFMPGTSEGKGLGGLSELLGGKNTSELTVGVLNSRTVADALIRKFDLQNLYKQRRMEDTRRELANWTDTSIDRKSQIITVSVTDKDPRRAAAMADTYIEELNRLLAQVSTSAARRERIFLEDRLQGVNHDLEVAEKEFSQFSSKNTAIDITAQGKAMVEAAANLQGRLIAARSELEALRQIYSDSNVRVRSSQARVAELEDQLKQLGGDDASLQNAGSNDSVYPSIRKLPLLGVTYADLYRKSKVQETLFATLTEEYEMAKVQEAKEIPTVKVLDPPNIPDKKSFPPRTLIVVLGTVLALSCAVAWVLGRARWEAVDPADPGKVFALEVFHSVKTSIPWASRNGKGSGLKSKAGNTEADETGRGRRR